jgi:peptidoglycan/xylan/chitin deacetylase (PgdA/CDA1 family)
MRDLVVSPELFEAQLTALQQAGWTTVTAATLAEHLASREPLPKKSMVITMDDGRADGYTNAFPILQKLGFVATYYVITGRIERDKYLSVAQLQEMAAAGMEIANHTVHHIDVSKKTAAYITNEVQEAQDQLTAWLGAAPITFAYPFGDHPKLLEQAVANAHLQLAFTTVVGKVHSRKTALLSPRIRVQPSTTVRRLLALLA